MQKRKSGGAASEAMYLAGRTTHGAEAAGCARDKAVVR